MEATAHGLSYLAFGPDLNSEVSGINKLSRYSFITTAGAALIGLSAKASAIWALASGKFVSTITFGYFTTMQSIIAPPIWVLVSTIFFKIAAVAAIAFLMLRLVAEISKCAN